MIPSRKTDGDATDFIEVLKSDSKVVKHLKNGEPPKLFSLDFHLEEVKNRFKRLGLA